MNNQERKDYEEKLQMQYEFERKKSAEISSKEFRWMGIIFTVCILLCAVIVVIS